MKSNPAIQNPHNPSTHKIIFAFTLQRAPRDSVQQGTQRWV